MNIILVTYHQYQVGTALTNRIRSYLEILAKLDNSVKVVIFRPSEDRNNIQNLRKGKLNGVVYYNTAYSIIKPTNPFIARITWIYGYLNCLYALCKENLNKHIDIIIFGCAKSSLIPLVYIFTRLKKIKFVLENNEYPWFILKKKSLLNQFDKMLYLNLYYKMFDGVLAMTKALCKYHQIYSCKRAKIFHLPMTVDMQRFNINIVRENLITYIGNKSYYKDGVEILVKSFIMIANLYPDWNLMIIGDSGNNNMIEQLAINAGLEERIILMGNVHRDKVPELLCRSKILALARPNNLQAEGGFPTKLGEYLSTGNLVIVTAVGDIPLYLKDNESALIAQPGDIKSFADKIKYAIENYENLNNVRKSGYNVCVNNFDSKLQGLRLSEFFQQLINE